MYLSSFSVRDCWFPCFLYYHFCSSSEADVGIHYLSVAAYDDLIPSHLVFLEGRVRKIFDESSKKWFLKIMTVLVDSFQLVDCLLPSTHYPTLISLAPKEEVVLILYTNHFSNDIQPGIYSVHCLPLRLPGAEGSPIRCILIKWCICLCSHLCKFRILKVCFEPSKPNLMPKAFAFLVLTWEYISARNFSFYQFELSSIWVIDLYSFCHIYCRKWWSPQDK